MGLDRYSPNELAVLSTVFAMLLCENLDINEQNLLSAFLQGVGQTICIINTQLQIIESQQESQQKSQSNNNCNMDDLQKEIDELKKQIKKLEHKIN